MGLRDRLEERVPSIPGTLGAVLYNRSSKPLAKETEWTDLVRAVAVGEQAALHALYQRAHRLVFTLAVRIVGNRETAEEITLDVFHDVWRRAPDYDPANGTVLGWIMNLARSRSIDRVRFEQRQKRRVPEGEAPEAETSPDPRDILELKQWGGALHHALAVLTPQERAAVECAFFAELTHAETAARLGEPLGTVKTRIRSALQKLRQAMRDEGTTP
jgi:RNA polymerase sigma-70 factor (ECF subfamily)